MKNQKPTQNMKIIIAGPCAAETREQILEVIDQAKKREIDFVRSCLWKPRTRPGFDGLAEKGITLLTEIAHAGLNPATEVLTPEQAQLVIDQVLSEAPESNLLLWIGSRNQNHLMQREIARIAAKEQRVFLMIKNQPWFSQDHWEGIIEHALDGGISHEKLILCHRGFVSSMLHPDGYRNKPEFDMAMRVKEKTGLPMIFDPSHIGGSAVNVAKVTLEAQNHAFDGVIVEVHPDPKQALTDAKQQLTWTEFDNLFPRMAA
jgi:chorismate mutase